MLASAFAVVLNFCLLATFVWPGSLHSAFLVGGWLTAGALWSWGTCGSYRRRRLGAIRPSTSGPTASRDESLGGESLGRESLEKVSLDEESLENEVSLDEVYREAQVEYLRGHWFEAESLLHELLEGNSNDLEARLMLATLYRRTGRAERAREQLDRLRGLRGGEHWALERNEEIRLLERAAAKTSGIVT